MMSRLYLAVPSLLIALLAPGVLADKGHCNGDDPLPCCPDEDPCCECCSDADCDDGDECTEDECVNNTCQYPPGSEGEGDPEIIGFDATAVGTFLDDFPYDNNLTVEVDWKCHEPGEIRFDWQPLGQVYNRPISGSTLQDSAAMGSVLAYEGSVRQNRLFMTPITADGLSGAQYDFDRFGGQLAPSWMSGLAFKESVFIEDFDPLHMKFEYEFKRWGSPDNKYDHRYNFSGDPTGLFKGAWGLTIDPIVFSGEYWLDPEDFTHGEWKLTVGAGLSGTRYQKKNLFGKSLYKIFGRNKTIPDKGTLSVEASAQGSVHPELTLEEVSIEAGLAGTIPLPKVRFAIPPIPPPIFYFQVKIGAEITVATNFTQTEEAGILGSNLEWNGVDPPTFGVNIAGTVGAGGYKVAGFSLGDVNGTVKLWGEMTPLSWTPGFNGLSGAAGLHGKIMGSFAFWDWTIVEGHLVRATWSPTTFDVEWLVSADKNADGLFAPQWKPADRSYATTAYMQRPVLDQRSSTPDPLVLSNVWPRTQPSLLHGVSERLLAIDWDDPALPQDQALEIGVLRDSGAGWQSLETVTDDTILDVKPQLAEDSQGTPVVVWTRFPGLVGGEQPEQASTHSEIAYASYDDVAQAWSTPVLLTNNSHQDWPARLVLGEDASLQAFWLGSPSNSLPVSPIPDSPIQSNVYSAWWNGSGFSAPELAIPGLSAESVPAVFVDASGIHYALWSQGTDGDPLTSEDLEIYFAVKGSGAWSAPIRVTDDTIADASPLIYRSPTGEISALWVQAAVPEPQSDNGQSDRIVASSFSSGSWSAAETVIAAEGIADVRLVPDASGELWVQWLASSNNASDLWVARFDPPTQSWSEPVQVTDDPQIERGATVLRDGQGNLAAVYMRTEFSEPVDPPAEGETAFPSLGQADLIQLEHVPAPDLFVLEDEVLIEPFDAAPGDPVTVTLTLRNAGVAPASIGALSVYLNDPAQGGTLVQTFSVNPPPFRGGASQEWSFAWTLPPAGELQDLYLVADPDGVIAESDESNNVAIVPLYAPDLFGVLTTGVTCNPDGTMTVAGAVGNEGTAVTSDAVIWEARHGTTGALVADGSVRMPAPGQQTPIEIVLANDQFIPLELSVDPADLIEEVNEGQPPYALTVTIDSPGNVDGRGGVGIDDLVLVLADWGDCSGCTGDLNGNGVVNLDDLLIVLSNWGGCPLPAP